VDARNLEVYRALLELKRVMEQNAPTSAGWNNDVREKKEALLDVLARQGDSRVAPGTVLRW
jgi:hypothetical protein